MSILNLKDEDLAEKFRQEYSEQYNILVRMHLSFVLDLNTDENEYLNEKSKNKKWKLVSFMKKSKSTDALDGFPFTQDGMCQVYHLIEYLRKEQNLKTEGIFRRTGSLSRQNELKSLLCQGVSIDLESGNFNVHDCASVLKVFLSELPEPLLTECHFPAYCRMAELCGVIEKPTQEEKLLEALQLILLLLPSDNRILLRDILDLLHLTASFEFANKMSADNLATLFTPHLLCPRKLSAEQLHSNSQNLSGIIAFMITHCGEIFKIPQKLIVEFRVRFEKRILQPKMSMNESVTDQNAANTVFTFIDRELTAKENEANSTETAVAQLYAYIQSLPESSKKRKLVKQFNKENGHGTPLQVLRSSAPKSKSLGDSIRKHILNKRLMRTIKKQSISQLRSSSGEVLNSPTQGILSRARLFCTNCDKGPVKVKEDQHKLTFNASNTSLPNDDCIHKSFSEPDLTSETDGLLDNSYLTSTPACFPLYSCFTPEGSDRKSMSPITRSTQRMTRAMQETMMTPRSRKPVLLISGNILPKIDSIQAIDNESSEHELNSNNEGKKISSASLTSTFREYLSSRDILNCSGSPKDLSFSSRTDDFTSNDLENLSNNKMSRSLLNCLDGIDPEDTKMDSSEIEEKELVLKPKQFDENGHPIIFETSF